MATRGWPRPRGGLRPLSVLAKRRRAAAEVDRLPAVQRSGAAERPVALAFGFQCARRDGCWQFVDEAVAVAHAEVVDRPDVGPAQLEEQEHLGRPATDAADGDQPGDDL